MGCTIQKISGSDFEKVWNGSNREKYQIIDAREHGDFALASGDVTTDIINLPLGNSYKWSKKLVEGSFLNSRKPTICVCADGLQSYIMTEFLVRKANFAHAYFVEGGIPSYKSLGSQVSKQDSPARTRRSSESSIYSKSTSI